jgi:hypothetical protein
MLRPAAFSVTTRDVVGLGERAYPAAELLPICCRHAADKTLNPVSEDLDHLRASLELAR